MIDNNVAALLLGALAISQEVAADNPITGRFGSWAKRASPGRGSQQARGSGFSGLSTFGSGSAGAGFRASSFGGSTSYGGRPMGYGGYGGGISSYDQNGYSSWGTYNASSLPYYAGGGYSSHGGFPWGSISTGNANPYTSAPTTGTTTRTYQLTLSNCNIKPDDVVRNGAFCVNGQFLGPLIIANYSDTLSVTVTNNLTGVGTSMHWHGFLQTNNNQNDSVPGVT